MSLANFGIGIGAFADGITRGMDLGRQIKKQRNENEIEQIRKEGLDAARNSRERDITQQVRQIDIQLPDEVQGPPALGYQVGDKQFEDEASAREFAGKSVASVTDRFYQDAVPKISEAYLKQGNIEMAESWRQYADSKAAKRHFQDWYNGFKAYQLGDVEGVADYVADQYASYNDGFDLAGKSAVKDKDGNLTGFNITLKDQKSGEEIKQFVDRGSLLQYGQFALGQTNPQAMFEQEYKANQEAEQMRAKQNFDLARDDLKFQRDVQMEGVRQQGRYGLAGYNAQLDEAKAQRQFNTKVDLLKQAGWDDNAINRILPQLMGVKTEDGMYKKPTSPEEAKRMLYSDLIKNDYQFSRMSPEEQEARLDQALGVIYSDQQPSRPAQQGANGLPQPVGNTPYVRDRQTGQIIDTRTGKPVQ